MSGEFISEDEKTSRVNGFTRDEQVIMIRNRVLQNKHRSHRRRHRKTDLRRRGSPPQPIARGLERSPPIRTPLRLIAVARGRNPTGTETDRIWWMKWSGFVLKC
ncbi:hypothetical protein SDJN02_03043, partial [Cucurbita argyrosperma subsp. argyrosperma]